jgi:hypothetical protein
VVNEGKRIRLVGWLMCVELGVPKGVLKEARWGYVGVNDGMVWVREDKTSGVIGVMCVQWGVGNTSVILLTLASMVVQLVSTLRLHIHHPMVVKATSKVVSLT